MAPPPPTYDPYGAYPVSQVPMAPPPTLPATPVPAPSSYMPVQVIIICSCWFSFFLGIDK